MSGPNNKKEKHPEYNIRGGDLYISCGQTLYKIHSYFFLRESAYWRNELTGSAGSSDSPLTKGNKENAPYILEEKPEVFEQFLWVFYNPKYGDYSKATAENWDTILRYSDKWDFPHIKELAIRHLQTHEMLPIARLKLYEETKVPAQHLFPLFRQVAVREEMLTLEESRMLSLETLVLIQHARERLRAQTSADKPLHCPTRKNIKDTEIAEIIASTFNISLSDIPAKPSA